MSTLKKDLYAALIEFIDKNQNSIYRLAYSYVKSQDTALDMVQESIVKAIKGYERLENTDSIKPWFYKILVNTCLDELRRSKRMIATAPEDIPEGSDENFSKEADYIALRTAIESLDTKTKTVVMLRYFEDMKLSDISNILEENLNSVKTRLYRGLAFLKIEME